MLFHFHTKAILYNSKGEIFVQKRSDTGKRDLVGGKTEVPERIEDAIVREIAEETGISKVDNLHVVHVESSYSSENDKYFVLVIFQGHLGDDLPELSDEHQEYRWVVKEELFTIGMTDYLLAALEKIKKLL